MQLGLCLFLSTGMSERLIQTPLTDKCFLTLTQALNMKLGGNPFGPAGKAKKSKVASVGVCTYTYESRGLRVAAYVCVFVCICACTYIRAEEIHACTTACVGLVAYEAEEWQRKRGWEKTLRRKGKEKNRWR